MTKLRVLVCLMTALCAIGAKAQDQPTTPPATPSSSSSDSTSAPPKVALSLDTHTPAKFEASFGYTFRTYNGPLGGVRMNGAYVSGDYNIFRWLGASAEAVAATRNVGTQSIGTAQSYTVATFMAGPEFYPTLHHKLTPFGHILAGVGGLHFTAPAYAGFGAQDVTSSSLAYEGGVGVDMRIKAHWAVRLIELDYGQTKFYGGSGANQSSVRFSAGVVYLKGQKASK
jgi:hypothetical protein